MTTYDYQLFDFLVKLSQDELYNVMSQYLTEKYKKVVQTKDYLIAIGDIPIALVAHMDTVFLSPVKNLFFDKEKEVFWSPEGLGSDDRAGIFAILKILEGGLRPSVILTTNEEIGGLGAAALSETKCPIRNLKYLIELDRQGANECVFYFCGNQQFINYIKDFGFIFKEGTFSDISFLMLGWQKCAVNLSVGYLNEHTTSEFLQMQHLYATIEKVKKMLTASDIPDFKYEGINNCKNVDDFTWDI